MNNKDKREIIGNYFDISKNRFKENELDSLINHIEDESNIGKSIVKKNSFDGWSSDGKYTRNEERIYTINEDKSIDINYSYYDDDGQKGNSNTNVSDGRGVLKLLDLFK